LIKKSGDKKQKKTEKNKDFAQDLKDLNTLNTLADELGLFEIEFQEENKRLYIKKNIKGIKESSIKKETLFSQEETDHTKHDFYYKKIISPLSGTFYSSPSPNSSPYVKEGDYVEKGQVLCLIEAMKFFNEIKTDTNGQIAKVFFENVSYVKEGDILFLLKTEG
jgi:biotin carboxyl carrier protein